jgi:hypothetical protein
MQLQYLKRACSRSHVWPPCGDGRYSLCDTPRLREAGTLTGVSRIGNRLSVTIQFDGQEHVTFLQEWTEPPTIDQVHAALRKMLGKRVWEVGQADVDDRRRGRTTAASGLIGMARALPPAEAIGTTRGEQRLGKNNPVFSAGGRAPHTPIPCDPRRPHIRSKVCLWRTPTYARMLWPRDRNSPISPDGPEPSHLRLRVPGWFAQDRPPLITARATACVSRCAPGWRTVGYLRQVRRCG